MPSSGGWTSSRVPAQLACLCIYYSESGVHGPDREQLSSASQSQTFFIFTWNNIFFKKIMQWLWNLCFLHLYILVKMFKKKKVSYFQKLLPENEFNKIQFFYCLSIYFMACIYVCRGTWEWGWGQLTAVGSRLPPHRSQGSNLGHQSWQQVPLPTEQPPFFFF